MQRPCRLKIAGETLTQSMFVIEFAMKRRGARACRVAKMAGAKVAMAIRIAQGLLPF
jgi:hypothetical protein